MSRRATLIITGLLICSMNAPFVTYAAMNKAVGSQTAVSKTFAAKRHVKKRRKLDVGALVKDNVISRETGERIKAYLKKHSKEYRAERDKVIKMTDVERRAYFAEKYPNGKPDIWSDMTAEGVITPEEADAIRAALHVKYKGR